MVSTGKEVNAAGMSVEYFNSSIKHLSLEELTQMADKVGVNNWNTIGNKSIRRMRLIMEIKNFHFPKVKAPKKSNSSEWSSVSTDALVEFAESKGLKVQKSNNSQIQRMWVIVALNKSGFNLKDVTGEGVK